MYRFEQRALDGDHPGNMPLLTIEQDLPSDLRLLDDAVAGIIAMIKCSGCWDDVDDIDLAVREAVTNAIIHGNRCDQSKMVHICVELHKDRGLLIVIKDAGLGFDPSRIPNPLGQGRMSNHGRGIFLIKKCMDDVRYKFDPGTAIYMRRYFDLDDRMSTVGSGRRPMDRRRGLDVS